ncbi:MAG: phage Gp37/Gp68 family protein [Desulfovibrio sp.]|nr:phage Gp37/Gp68 family protein [Desulfovibrio sp.]
MSNNIGWCDCTINPVVGCTKCSPGCENCYAEKFAARMSRNPQTRRKYEGVVDAYGKWTGKINFGTSKNDNDMPLDVPGKNKRVFVGSMSDIFHPNVRELTRDVIFASILCDHIRPKPKGHTFMMLTKRAKEMRDYFSIDQDIVTRWWGGVEPEEDVT